jgi:RNA recognition motif-containing protein
MIETNQEAKTEVGKEKATTSETDKKETDAPKTEEVAKVEETKSEKPLAAAGATSSEAPATAPSTTVAGAAGKPNDRGPRNPRRNPHKDTTGGEPNDEERGRRVYVGNLAWEVSWQDLKDIFKNAGHEVTRADIMQTSDGRSKGCGIVEFATAEAAKQAVLTMNDTEIHGRQIFVREDREDRGGSGGGFTPRAGPGGGGGGGVSHKFSSGEQAQNRRVYIGNLSWDVAWQDLKDHMRQAGDVVHAEVICEHNGRSKGCGIVEFATDEQAKEAITTLTDTELKGRMIFVREDRETASGGAVSSGGSVGAARNQNTSVYVWNLSYDTTWQELKDHMRKAGNVDQATVLSDPEGQSIGCGVVVYQRAHEASRAIRELQGSELKGRPINIREDRVQSGHGHHGGGGGGGGRGFHGGRGGRGGGRGHFGGPPHHGGGGGAGAGAGNQPHFRNEGASDGCQLFVGNLSFETSWRELKDHFRQCGDVERADVKFSEGKSRGFGTVRFYKKQDAEAAIGRLNGVELQGRALEVRLDHKA